MQRTTYTYDDGGVKPRIINLLGQRVNMIYDSGPNSGKARNLEEPADTPVIVRPVQNGTESVENRGKTG
jgi:hypothetical protein